VANESEAAAVLSPDSLAADLPIDRLGVGDNAALASLYRQHHEAVRAFARRLIGNHGLAEDLVHDVFLAAPAAIRRFRHGSGIRTLLFSIAVNKAKHYVRAAVRLRSAMGRLAAEPAASSGAPADEALERKELCSELQAALDRLPIEQRVVMVLCAVEELSAPEVSIIVGAPENTVRTRLFHARRKLRELMGGAP
jgi:RNA polymerase sigma-70 factor (ECF subfamily)